MISSDHASTAIGDRAEALRGIMRSETPMKEGSSLPLGFFVIKGVFRACH